jgi:hypothetical protein
MKPIPDRKIGYKRKYQTKQKSNVKARNLEYIVRELQVGGFQSLSSSR